MNDFKREIVGNIVSIVSALVFLVVGTLMWYNLHINYKDANEVLNNANKYYVLDSLNLDNITKTNDKNINKIESYKFDVINIYDENRRFSLNLVNDLSKNSISNNYIKYMIKKENGTYSEIRSLNMDGIIYIDDLLPNEIVSYEIKLWVSDNYSDNYDYHGNLMVTFI